MFNEVKATRTRKVYCGPYAMAALTGLTVDYIEEQINHRRKKNPDASVKWTNGWDLEFAGTQAKLSMGEIEPLYEENKTFARWLRERKPDEVNAKYLVLVTNHWVAVEGRKMIDTYTKTPTFIRRAPHRRKRVRVIIRIG